jgi:hypothetical protein
MSGIEITGYRTAQNWISRGWRIVRIFADRDGKVTYTLSKQRPARSHRKSRFAALFGEVGDANAGKPRFNA